MTTPPQIKSPLEQKALEASAKVTLGFYARLKRVWFRWADLNKHSPWFPFILGAIVAFDAIVVVLPGELIVIPAVLSNPASWKKLTFSAGLGSAIGSMIMFLLVRHFGSAWVAQHLGMEARWTMVPHFFRQHILFSLTLGSLIPGLTWPPVILAALSHSAALPAFLYLVVGRLLRYTAICFGTREGWAFFQTVRSRALTEARKHGAKDPEA